MNTPPFFYIACLLVFILFAITSCDRPSPCDGFECNYGNCIVSPDGTPKCDCYPGYFGDNCPYENYDPCLVLQCKNGGTCVIDSLNPRQAYCDCPPGFKGKNCESADPCYNNNGGCINGTCRDSLGIVLCDCLPGFIGAYCDITDFCYNIVCSPNATCNSTNGNCECITGYEFAPTCEQEMRRKFLGKYNATDLCEGNTTNYTCRILAGVGIQDIIIRNLGNRDSIDVKARILNSTTFIVSATQGFPYTAVPPYDSIYIVAPPIIFGAISINTPDTIVSFNYKYGFPGQTRVSCGTTLLK